MDVHAIHHVTVNVTDLDRAKAFYEGLLGLKEVPRPGSFGFGGAWYQLGPAQLHIISRDKPDPERSQHFAVQVMDVEAARRESAEAGLEPRDTIKIPSVDRFFIHDPDGNLIEVIGPETPWNA